VSLRLRLRLEFTVCDLVIIRKKSSTEYINGILGSWSFSIEIRLREQRNIGALVLMISSNLVTGTERTEGDAIERSRLWSVLERAS
jgi:hypothetical protein